MDGPHATVTLSWREWVTIRRLRLGWTKQELAKQARVSRVWLWRGLECPPENPRYVLFSDAVKTRVEAALDAGERELEAVDEAAV